MSATYNWSLKAGAVISVANGQGGGFTIAASADNVRPANCCYVALFGNDTTGNGSRQLPYRTLAKALSINSQMIAASGVYREFVGNSAMVIGDGDVVLDGTGFSSPGNGFACKNITVKNYANLSGSYCLADTCTFMDCGGDGGGNPSSIFSNCTFIRITSTVAVMRGAYSTTQNNTYIKCVDVKIDVTNVTNPLYSIWNDIFYQCNIACVTSKAAALSYSLFYQCNFRFAATYTAPTTLYPSVPTGFSQLNTLADIQTANLTAYTGNIYNFLGCQVADPLFNNAAIDDYTLQFSSPAKNATYRGTYIGSRSITQSLKISATESNGALEFSSAVNITIANDSLTLTNPALDAQVDSKVIVNSSGRELANFWSFGFMADRNGQYIDSIADLDTVTKAAGDTLTVPASYQVEGGSITYNSAVYTSGSRLTTVSGQTTFTTSTGGVLREILEAPQRHTIMARCSDGGATVTAGTALTVDYYYYVVSGSVTYDTVTYNAGTIFKAIDTNAFSGSGVVMLAMSTETFQHYEPGVKPTSNNTGDVRTGSIIRGNGDPNYVRGGIGVKEFPINAKFIQIRYYIRVNNLKP